MLKHCSQENSPHELIGSIEHRTDQLFIEVPEPWERVYSLSPHFSPKLLPVLQRFAKQFPNSSVSFLAPDPEYSDAKGLRVIHLRQVSPNSPYETFEYLIPSNMMGDELGRHLTVPFLEKSQASVSLRDYFICTHGSRDDCCGVFGKALYEKLRYSPKIQKAKIRVFRCSHIGGHRYAPTLLESPTLNCWGLLDEQTALSVLLREGDLGSLLKHYRGSASLSFPWFQVVERELMSRYGWDWFQFTDKVYSQEMRDDVCYVNVRFIDLTGKEITETFPIISKDPIPLRANCSEDKISLFPQWEIIF
jgi:hypothetical protein